MIIQGRDPSSLPCRTLWIGLVFFPCHNPVFITYIQRANTESLFHAHVSYFFPLHEHLRVHDRWNMHAGTSLVGLLLPSFFANYNNAIPTSGKAPKMVATASATAESFFPSLLLLPLFPLLPLPLPTPPVKLIAFAPALPPSPSST